MRVTCEARKGRTRSKYGDGGCCTLESVARQGMGKKEHNRREVKHGTFARRFG